MQVGQGEAPCQRLRVELARDETARPRPESQGERGERARIGYGESADVLNPSVGAQEITHREVAHSDVSYGRWDLEAGATTRTRSRCGRWCGSGTPASVA